VLIKDQTGSDSKKGDVNMRKTGVLILVLLVLVAVASCEKEEQVPTAASQKVLSGPSEATALEQGSKDPATAQASSTGAGTPRIAFDEKDFDFGKVDMGEKVEKVYKFRNTGDGTLVIQRVRSG
jgi:hypothetical protein